MQKSIKLEGGKEVKLAANAATPFRFKQLFNKDLLKVFNDNSKEDADTIEMADVFTEMAFIMNRQAEGIDMSGLSMDDFYSWLEGFEPMDFVMKGQEILEIYLSSTQVSVEAKKKPN